MCNYIIMWLIFLACFVEQGCSSSPFECGMRPKFLEHFLRRKKRIVGGNESRIHSWPWLVNFIDKKDQRQYCSGSIINHEWILTAAHCFVFLELDKRVSLQVSAYIYRVADHIYNNTGPHEYIVETSELHIHPQYQLADSVQPGDYDLALVKLKLPLNFTEHVQPICLPEKNTTFPVGHSCFLAGWGNVIDKEGYYRSNILKETKVNLVSFEECNSNRSFNGTIPTSFLCAGFLQGGTDGCFGDSGAPLQCSHNGTYTVVGIMSWGKGCAKPKFYGVYTDVTRLFPFVEQVLKGPNKQLIDYYEHKRKKCYVMTTLLHKLFTNDGRYTDFDLVRSLQLLPHHINLSKNVTLNDFCYVANAINFTTRLNTVQNVLIAFLKLSERLEIYRQCKRVACELNVKLTDMTQYFKLSMPELLNPSNNITLILDRFRKAYAASPQSFKKCN